MQKALALLLAAAPLAVLAEKPWFQGSLQDAIRAAAQQNKIVTLKFYADW